ncbi:MAG: type II toxin-antitoxin system VapC family toxin [Deinococcus sp.]|nr:type II toxin-antitoxin system VapC family toxin [Deinococcus sp.]
MNRYLLDSDVLIWYLRKRSDTRAALHRLQQESVPHISVLSIFEVQVGMLPSEARRTNQFLSGLLQIPLDPAIATLAAQQVRTLRTQGISLSPIDAMIAATAMQYGLTLVTYNSRHYPMPELQLLALPYRVD